MTKKRGRPSTYKPVIARKICERLSNGESLRAICRDEGMPPESTVRQWYIDDAQGFAAHYARARDMGLDSMADEILEIANTPMEGVRTEQSADGTKEVREDMLGHRRLQVDARKWYLSKLAPKRYGDSSVLALTGPDGEALNLTDSERAEKIAELLAAAAQRKAGGSDPD